MTTLVMPLSILFAGIGLQSLLHITFGWRQRRVAQLAAPVAVFSLLALQWPTLRFSENSGLTAQLRVIEATLPDGPIVIRGYEGFATTLALGFGRDVLPLRDEFVAVDGASRAYWATCSQRPCTLLHASYEGLDGLQLGTAQLFRWSHEYIQPTFHPLATVRRRETVSILASRVSGISANPPPSNVGAARDWRIDDRGLYRDELLRGAVARWTRGDATMTLAPTVAERVEVGLRYGQPWEHLVAFLDTSFNRSGSAEASPSLLLRADRHFQPAACLYSCVTTKLNHSRCRNIEPAFHRLRPSAST
jgi:hypothetical protein